MLEKETLPNETHMEKSLPCFKNIYSLPFPGHPKCGWWSVAKKAELRLSGGGYSLLSSTGHPTVVSLG
jgi:hypothetical protein